MLGSMQAMAQQPFVANYDENKVGNFTLPNPLKKTDGSLIQSVKDWEIQRTYWLGLYEQYMFGKMPKKKIAQSYCLLNFFVQCSLNWFLPCKQHKLSSKFYIFSLK